MASRYWIRSRSYEPERAGSTHGEEWSRKIDSPEDYGGFATAYQWNRFFPKEATIGYLPQQMTLDDGRSVREEASLALAHLQKMERELERLHQQMAERTDYESDEYAAIIERSTTFRRC